MPSAPDSGNNSTLSAGPDRVLYIAYISAARDESWLAGDHAIPDGARLFIAAVGGAKQVAFEPPAERRVDLRRNQDRVIARDRVIWRSKAVICIACFLSHYLFRASIFNFGDFGNSGIFGNFSVSPWWMFRLCFNPFGAA
jgi:hypothetical protein